EEQERDRGRARSSRFSGSTSSSRPRRGRETERAGGPSIWPATRPKKVRTASEEAVIRSARLGPNDRVREHKALAWVKQHECLTAGLVVLVVAVLAVIGWAIWWAAVGGKQNARVDA
ncbi:hypothetical protein JCM8208_005067, partial [Rhodotorula glutinis]